VTETVAIIGSGLIGRAWGMIFVRAGWQVRLWDPGEGVAAKAVGLCAEGLKDLATHGLCDDPAGAAARIAACATLEEAAAQADFIQENGPETLEVKRDLFARLDAAAPAKAIIASSSSAIRASLFTEGLAGRARCLIGHPVNPPHLIPLLRRPCPRWAYINTASTLSGARFHFHHSPLGRPAT
jgi:L-gulonate 3-dehydrogenase